MKAKLLCIAASLLATSALAETKNPLEDLQAIVNSPAVMELVSSNEMGVKAIELVAVAACGPNSPAFYKVSGSKYDQQRETWLSCEFSVTVSPSDGQCFGSAARAASAPSEIQCSSN